MYPYELTKNEKAIAEHNVRTKELSGALFVRILRDGFTNKTDWLKADSSRLAIVN